MLRLAVHDPCNESWRDIATRLRGASIEVATAELASSTGTFDAVVLLDGASTSAIRQAEQSLLAGKHVLLAAPLVATSDSLVRLVDAAGRGPGRLRLANPDRHLPSRQLIEQQLVSGKLGLPGLLRIRRWEAASPEPISDVTANPPIIPAPLLIDLDLALWLMKQRPNMVFAAASEVGDPSQYKLDAQASASLDMHSLARRACSYRQVHLGFPGGGMALIDYTNGLPPGDGYSTLSVIGSSGAAYSDDHANVQLLYQGGSPKALRSDEGIKARTSLVQSFVDALTTSVVDVKNESICLDEWRSVLNLAAAVAESVATHQAVALEDGR